MKMSEILGRLKERININRGNFIHFIALLIVVGVVVELSMVFNLAPIFLAIVLGVLILFSWYMAGVAVFRSLLSAGVGLTLLFYIAELYCKVPEIHRNADSSLQALLGFGLIYVIFIFANSLWKELVGDKEKDLKGSIRFFKDMNNGKKPWIILIPYAMFIGLFVYQLWQVIHPILNNFCVPF